jgi:hypothetical protein
VSLALVLGPAHPGLARASVWTPPAAFFAGPSAMDEVKQLYEEGKAKFDTYDYKGAVELWTKAYAKLPATEESREIRNNLAYNIATAQEKSFDLDGDVTHLRQARALLVKYVDEYKTIYRPTPEGRAEVKRVQERIAGLDARIAQAEGGGAATQPQPTAQPQPAAPPAPTYVDILKSDPELSHQYRKGRGMIIGGSVMIATGGASVLVALAIGVGPGSAGDGFSTPAAITFGVIGLGLAAGGAVLVGLGVPKRKKAVAAAKQKAAAPSVSFTGTGLSMRF